MAEEPANTLSSLSQTNYKARHTHRVVLLDSGWPARRAGRYVPPSWSHFALEAGGQLAPAGIDKSPQKLQFPGFHSPQTKRQENCTRDDSSLRVFRRSPSSPHGWPVSEVHSSFIDPYPTQCQ